MHRYKIILSTIGIICLVQCVHLWAEKSGTWDKLLDLPAIGVPVVTHSPETSWGFGAGLQGYFKLPEASRTSIVYADGCYTLNKQYYISAGGTLYFGGKTPWFMTLNGSYRNYPDVYFGLGNTITENRKHGTSFNSQRGQARIETQIYLPANWSIGPLFNFLHETIDTAPLSAKASLSPLTIMWGLGVVTQYDTRDTIYYPTSGLFFKASVTHYDKALGSTARLTYLKADLRHFVPLPYTIVFAWQFTTEWALSDNISSIPFRCLPTLGGQDLVRGVRRNMFCDNAMVALQTEFRFPIWRFIRLHVFAGIGDVYNTDNWNWTTPKIGYGLGLRLGINKAKVNIRFDIARNNIYKEWNTWNSYSFYLTATEAF